jgi:hypothetical protein
MEALRIGTPNFFAVYKKIFPDPDVGSEACFCMSPLAMVPKHKITPIKMKKKVLILMVNPSTFNSIIFELGRICPEKFLTCLEADETHYVFLCYVFLLT